MTKNKNKRRNLYKNSNLILIPNYVYVDILILFMTYIFWLHMRDKNAIFVSCTSRFNFIVLNQAYMYFNNNDVDEYNEIIFTKKFAIAPEIFLKIKSHYSSFIQSL